MWVTTGLAQAEKKDKNVGIVLAHTSLTQVFVEDDLRFFLKLVVKVPLVGAQFNLNPAQVPYLGAQANIFHTNSFPQVVSLPRHRMTQIAHGELEGAYSHGRA